MDDEHSSSGFNNFSDDGSFMDNFIKQQQEKKTPESAPIPVPKPKPRPLPPLRKPLVIKMSKRKMKQAPVLVKPSALLETPHNELTVEPEAKPKGEMSYPTGQQQLILE